MCIASSVEVGPGISWQAAIMSSSSCRENQRRRRTVASSIRAMCAAGPPNPVRPSHRNSAASSRSARAREGAAGGSAGADADIAAPSTTRQIALAERALPRVARARGVRDHQSCSGSGYFRETDEHCSPSWRSWSWYAAFSGPGKQSVARARTRTSQRRPAPLSRSPCSGPAAWPARSPSLKDGRRSPCRSTDVPIGTENQGTGLFSPGSRGQHRERRCAGGRS